MAETISAIIDLCVTLFYLLILARIFISLMQVDRYHPLVKFVYDLTEPILAPIRNLLPQAGMFDFSPLIAIIIIQVLAFILKRLVLSLF